MQKLKDNGSAQYDSSLGFERNRGSRDFDLTNGAANPFLLDFRGKVHVRIYLKDAFAIFENHMV